MPRDLGTLHVDRVNTIGQPESRQLDPVGAEGVRLEDVRSGVRVRLMDLCNQIRLGQIELVERAVQKNPARIQHRPHRAVADENTLVELVSEIG